MKPNAREADLRRRIADFARNPEAVDNLCRLLASVAGKTGRKSSEGGRKARKAQARARIEFYGGS